MPCIAIGHRRQATREEVIEVKAGCDGSSARSFLMRWHFPTAPVEPLFRQRAPAARPKQPAVHGAMGSLALHRNSPATFYGPGPHRLCVASAVLLTRGGGQGALIVVAALPNMVTHMALAMVLDISTVTNLHVPH